MDVRRSPRVSKSALENHGVPGRMLRELSLRVSSMLYSPGLQTVGLLAVDHAGVSDIE